MAIYVDNPNWERWHGPSGHMISDVGVAELIAFATDLGVDSRCFMPDAVCVHYQLPAALRERAIAAGAIPLDQPGFMQKVGAVQRNRQTTAAPVRVTDRRCRTSSAARKAAAKTAAPAAHHSLATGDGLQASLF